MIKTQNVGGNFPTSYSQNAAKQIGKNHRFSHFSPNRRVSRSNLLWLDLAFHAYFRRFSKGTVSPCVSVNSVPYCYLGVEPETDTGFLTTFRHQTGLLPAESSEWNVGLAGA